MDDVPDADLTEPQREILVALRKWGDGQSTTSDLKEWTSLTTRKVGYQCRENLEQMGLVEKVKDADVDGFKGAAKTPTVYRLTAKGVDLVEDLNEGVAPGEDLEQLKETIRDLSERLDEVERKQENIKTVVTSHHG